LAATLVSLDESRPTGVHHFLPIASPALRLSVVSCPFYVTPPTRLGLLSGRRIAFATRRRARSNIGENEAALGGTEEAMTQRTLDAIVERDQRVLALRQAGEDLS
jgi:hypothetical protein